MLEFRSNPDNANLEVRTNNGAALLGHIRAEYTLGEYVFVCFNSVIFANELVEIAAKCDELNHA